MSKYAALTAGIYCFFVLFSVPSQVWLQVGLLTGTVFPPQQSDLCCSRHLSGGRGSDSEAAGSAAVASGSHSPVSR